MTQNLTIEKCLDKRIKEFYNWLLSVTPDDKKHYLNKLKDIPVEEFVLFIKKMVIPLKNNKEMIVDAVLQHINMKITDFKQSDIDTFFNYLELFTKFIEKI